MKVKLDDVELEKLEKGYLRFISLYLRQGCSSLIEEVGSLIESQKDLGLFFHYFLKPIFTYPVSLPSDGCLMFELPDAFIQIEIKTALIDNPADYKGKINIAINQTSYSLRNLFTPNLPKYYRPQGETEKPCLTYVIQIIHEHAKPNIKALKLVCVPNGQLYRHYGKSVFKSGKGGYKKAKDFRYQYSAEPYFKLLKKKYDEEIFRVELVYLAKNLKPEETTGLKNIPVYSQS